VRASKTVSVVASMCAVWFGVPASAHAQSVTIATPSASACDAGAGAGAGIINYADCECDATLTFTLTVSNPSAGDTLQAWVGPPASEPSSLGCSAPAARQSGGGCWPVASTVPNSSITSPITMTVRARDIAYYLGNASPPTSYDDVGSTPGVKSVVDLAGANACQQQPIPETLSLGIQFMLVETDGTVDGNLTAHVGFAEWPIQAGTLGPNAPSDVSVSVNDQYATVSWTPSSDTAIAGYNVYCQNFGAIDAATPSPTEGGSGAGGISGGVCGSSLFSGANVFTKTVMTVADSGTADADDTDLGGAVPESGLPTTTVVTQAGISQIVLGMGGVSLCASPTDDRDGALTAGSTTSSATISLTNFDYYAFGVAAVDTLGNVGPLGGPITCGTPGPIADFWYAYTNDGGLAGGGYCALEAVGMPAGGAVMGIGVSFFAVGLVRRRRRRPGDAHPPFSP
jgi:hypothetical protein